MCRGVEGSGLSRRDFLRVTAAGSALLWAPGRLSALAQGDDALTPLETAYAAARWIRASRVTTPRGVTWPAAPGTSPVWGTSLYTDAPGVLLFLSELAYATGDDETLADAVAGADHLMGLVTDGEVSDPGLYTGLAGIAFALEQVYRVSDEPRFRDGARTCVDRIVRAARPDRGGVGWAPAEVSDMNQASSDVVSGAAGIGLALLWAHETWNHPEALETALAAGTRLGAVGETVDQGLRWLPSPGNAREYPNFSHGTAGVAYFLARLATVTGDGAFVAPAQAGATYLQGVSRCDADGCAVFHHAPGGEDLYYLSWCHGPPGTARLFHQLGLATGDRSWGDWVLRGAEAVQGFGVPERRSPGYWNNISQCCGDAGVGDFFLALEGLTGDAAHGRYAQRVGTWLQGQSTESEGGLEWIQAENRVSPEDVVAQTGWMQGAAGVGAFFLHLDGRASGRKALVNLPDSPWAGMV